MKGFQLLAVIVLVVAVSTAAGATTVGCYIDTYDGLVTYNYTLSSSESDDWITSFHIYTPDSDLPIVTASAPEGWSFYEAIDEITGAGDYYWVALEGAGTGIGDAESGDFSFSLPAGSVISVSDFILEDGLLGNWGYETENWAGFGVLVSFPSVAVPSTVPEPATLIVMGVGCIALLCKRKKS